MQIEVAGFQQQEYSVVLMGDYTTHIGLGEEESPNRSRQSMA